MATKTVKFLGVTCRTLKPTKHRPAVWENMLGTVYALNDAGECRYFDYNVDAALEFAGVTPERDPRAFRVVRGEKCRYIRKGATEAEPREGKMVLWVR